MVFFTYVFVCFWGLLRVQVWNVPVGSRWFWFVSTLQLQAAAILDGWNYQACQLGLPKSSDFGFKTSRIAFLNGTYPT